MIPDGTWKVLGRELVVAAPPWVTLHRERVELPAGVVIDDFYRVTLPSFTVIVPLTPESDVVTLCGYTHGVGRIHRSVPTGMIEEGEASLDAARRELLEETGYASTEWQALGAFVVDTNRHCGVAHVFVARNVRRVADPKLDRTECFDVEVMAVERLLEGLMHGEVCTLPSVAGVALALLHERRPGWAAP